mmetsp:Transcript_19147/g.27268  ORF Transcript_19147/g.27268 Transcript_19147/m.27268 type:complete len:113 (+) Transcript_19147:31-369(+)
MSINLLFCVPHQYCNTVGANEKWAFTNNQIQVIISNVGQVNMTPPKIASFNPRLTIYRKTPHRVRRLHVVLRTHCLRAHLLHQNLSHLSLSPHAASASPPGESSFLHAFPLL